MDKPRRPFSIIDNVVVGGVKDGDIYGEIGMLCCKPQLFTARTNQECHLLRMNRTTFLNILQANLAGGTTIMSNLLQHMRDENNPTMEKIVLQIENMIGQHRMDLVTGLTALRGEGLSDCVVGEKKKLHKICQKTFGFLPHEIRREDGTPINDIKVIRDGDNLIVTSNLIAPILAATSILPFGPSSSCRKITPITN